ncbi:hypothetical protein FA95DRAFT_1613649 [Auriscalpium vulgare]|uniref:Uncharacterized protein n=1 Tax=Auriscalpium vulgare TaxID=40419 RepID=A0ACB8R2F1_9AGAM|nr:hypothetical protein FA95DRAFT_1613649 [Auriscalpium vulgare]
MYSSHIAFLILAVFSVSCVAAPIPGNYADVHAGLAQPELSARDPFNVGDLFKLNHLGSAIAEAQRRDDELASGNLQSPTGSISASQLQAKWERLPPGFRPSTAEGDGGATNRQSLAERDITLPYTLETNLLIGAGGD